MNDKLTGYESLRQSPHEIIENVMKVVSDECVKEGSQFWEFQAPPNDVPRIYYELNNASPDYYEDLAHGWWHYVESLTEEERKKNLKENSTAGKCVANSNRVLNLLIEQDMTAFSRSQ